MSRTLRSKRLRALLWQAADGQCQRCGGPLGDDWHADHVVPWKVEQRTNVHEMQALCADCNRKKGTQYMRRFQREALQLAQRIKAFSSGAVNTLIEVTPGGGKSSIPAIFAKELIPSRADALCWIVPRESLQEQAELNFQDGFFRQMLGHTLEVRQSTNDQNPCRDKMGFVTTYQAVAANPQALLHEFSKGKRYILVLDEPHHVAVDESWHKVLAPIYERAAWRILMSGTLERGDGRRIAFVPYRDVLGGAEIDYECYRTKPDWAVIRYSRRDALNEQAIKPLHFHHVDGRASWIDQNGSAKQFGSFEQADKADSPAFIYTALNTEYAHQVLERTVQDWQITREVNPRAKLLVVAARIGVAKQYLTKLRKMGVSRAEIATSEETAAAKQAIRQFKLPPDDGAALDALVTVAMAYEGLDVPAITHIACLTHIRSRPWIEQMLARAGRVDRDAGEYALQKGAVWVPDDLLMRGILQRIKEEQSAFVRDPLVVQDEHAKAREAGEEPRPVLPVTSGTTRTRMSAFGLDAQTDAAMTEQLERIARQCGIPANAVQLQAFLDTLQREATSLTKGDVFAPAPLPTVVPSQREAAYRKNIEASTRRLDGQMGLDRGTWNTRLKAHFGKARDEMTEAELIRAWTWLQEAEASNVIRA